MTVIDFESRKLQMLESYRDEPHSKGGKDGGGPGGPDDMEQRVANLEQVTADMRVTLAQINERTASIEKHGATKSDLANLKVWFVLTAIALSGTAFAAARFIS